MGNAVHLDAAICIPVLNEVASISNVLNGVADAMDGGRYSVCLVDDGSTDGTLDVIRRLMTSNPRIHLLEGRRRGMGCQRGQASRRGLEWLLSHTDHSVFVDLDADGSQRPEELPVGLGRLAETGAEVVIGSKYLRDSRVVGRPWGRRASSRMYNLFLRAFLSPEIHDFSNSYRFYSRRAAELTRSFPIRYQGPVHLLEMMAVWLANDLRIVEYPTFYNQLPGAVSKVRPVDFVAGIAGAMDVVARYRLGRYRLPELKR